MNRKWWLIAVLLLLAVHDVKAQQNASPTTHTKASERLRPGDIIRLWIWQEKEMSGEFLVPESGRVVLPRIGEQSVVSLSKPALRDSIINALRVYLNNPSIEVTFLKRINILGAVRQPGIYPVDETMNIATALALAGGAMREGKQDKVELFRGDQRMVANINRRTRIAELPLESGDQLFVPERGWISRNTPIVATLLSGMVSVGIAVITTR